MTYSNYTRTTSRPTSLASQGGAYSSIPSHSHGSARTQQHQDLPSRENMIYPPRPTRPDNSTTGGMRQIDRTQDFHQQQSRQDFTAPNNIEPTAIYNRQHEILAQNIQAKNAIRFVSPYMHEHYPIGVVREVEQQQLTKLDNERDRALRHSTMPYPPGNPQPSQIIRGFDVNPS